MSTDSESSGPASVRGVAAFVFTYLLIASVAAAGGDNWEFAIYIAVVLIVGLLVLYMHRRVDLSRGVLWGLAVWGLAHMLGGLLPVPEGWPIAGDQRVLYSLWLIPEVLKYDHVVHAYGFGVATWVCWEGIRGAVRARGGSLDPSFGVLVLVAAAGMGFGALNEIVEFAATLTVPETNVGGYMNTGLDLVSNLVGVLVAAVLIRVTQRG